MKWRTSPMAVYRKRINYRKKYPDLSEAVIEVLQKSDRKMEYQQYDIKVQRCRIDSSKQSVTYIPSWEDSYDRLIENDHQFAVDGESMEDSAVKAVMIENMLNCLKLLSPQEQDLITKLFFEVLSEHQLARKTGIPRMTLHDRKIKILNKLKKLMEN